MRKFKDSEECYVACEHIKVRDVVSVPLIVISDSKLHDTYFVRHFLSNVLLGQNGWLLNQTREPDLSSRIRSIDICSDGAAAHFKQKCELPRVGTKSGGHIVDGQIKMERFG